MATAWSTQGAARVRQWLLDEPTATATVGQLQRIHDVVAEKEEGALTIDAPQPL